MPGHKNNLPQIEGDFIETMKKAIKDMHSVSDEALNRMTVECFGNENGAIDRYINDFLDHTKPQASFDERQQAVDEYKKNQGALPPAFTNHNGKISVLDVHPDFSMNGHADNTLYKSVLIHEAMHSVSHESQGLQSHSSDDHYNWDEALTDYLAEQVAKKLADQVAPNSEQKVVFRSNYYTNTGSKVNTIQLRSQMESEFSEVLENIKHCYFNHPEQFKGVLEKTDLSATKGKSVQDYADNTLKTDIGDRTYKNLQSNSQIKTLSPKDTALIQRINNALPEGTPQINPEAIPNFQVFIYGENTKKDFKDLIKVAYPSENNDLIPDVFHANNRIYVFCEAGNLQGRPHRTNIGEQVKDASIRATIESHFKSNNIHLENVEDICNSIKNSNNNAIKQQGHSNNLHGRTEAVAAPAPSGNGQDSRALLNNALASIRRK
ncbi:hypothetical protein [Parachitinimonas caeni]|uniref:Uncharacterized protein n=1 Tax=Parachitinimonas caeni TaxID=3031301 RepID=A0ABT7E2V2_9NEIS|nr:hypothetical protein [Parachitinimonas caeni]MDK2126628.1 hypothetical protein [Parachitinimonas caeni]